MGRHSKLTDAQWKEVERRILAGEAARKVGADFGISEAAIRKKFGANLKISAQSSQVRFVAEKIADANTALEALPINQRPIAVGLAEQLKSISRSLASAAEMGAKTAHRLSAIANSEAFKIDDASPEQGMDILKGVAALTSVANESGKIALGLLQANKDAVKQMNTPEDDGPPSGVLVVPGVMQDPGAWTSLVQGGR